MDADRIARWNGTSWSSLGAIDGTVGAMAVYDDGSGPALYAGGKFTSAGGLPADRIARWDGSSWSALGSGANADLFALASFDDGGGARLHIGGVFTSVGGVAASEIARWDGSSWAALDTGVSGTLGTASPQGVRALVAHDDVSGEALFILGDFEQAGGAPIPGCGKWTGAGRCGRPGRPPPRQV